MPYKNTTDLPMSIKNALPAHAQSIYMNAFNNAWNEYKKPKDRRGETGREEVSHRVAWSAVKKSYEKGSNGKWHAM